MADFAHEDRLPSGIADDTADDFLASVTTSVATTIPKREGLL